MNDLKLKIMVYAFKIRLQKGENFDQIASDYPVLTISDIEAIRKEVE